MGLLGTGPTGGLSLVIAAGGMLRLTYDVHGVAELAGRRHALRQRGMGLVGREAELRAAIEAVERELERRAGPGEA